MVSRTLIGGCRCGKVTVEVDMTLDLGRYNPRACDCNFCRAIDAAYISDTDGRAVIRTDEMSNLKFVQQGSKLAEFLFCAACEQLLGVRWHQYGSVNARVLFDNESLGKEITVSPKQLSPENKVSRWQGIWFPEFIVIHSVHKQQ